MKHQTNEKQAQAEQANFLQVEAGAKDLEHEKGKEAEMEEDERQQEKRQRIRRRISYILVGISICLLAAALCLHSQNRNIERQAGESAQELVAKLRIAAEIVAEKADAEYTKVLRVDGYDYIGILTFPTLKLQLPVMDTWSYPRLKLSPCCYAGSLEQNNLVIAGHNYDTHFGQLHTLKQGDTVLFTDVNDTVYTYQVACVETLERDAIEEMVNSDYALTLYTCTLGGENRVTVRCELME